MTKEGVMAANTLMLKFKTNVTLVFSAGQALLAAKARPLISPFIGRLDDVSTDGFFDWKKLD
jgi:transaldolase